jgi:hypothetical protein
MALSGGCQGIENAGDGSFYDIPWGVADCEVCAREWPVAEA